MVLAGLATNTLFGSWWLDPIVGLCVAAVAIREGVDAWRCEGCAAMPLPDQAACGCGPGCTDACCAAKTAAQPEVDRDLANRGRGRISMVASALISLLVVAVPV